MKEILHTGIGVRVWFRLAARLLSEAHQEEHASAAGGVPSRIQDRERHSREIRGRCHPEVRHACEACQGEDAVRDPLQLQDYYGEGHLGLR